MNLDIIKEYDMLPRGARVLCAVSGGADSMCLLHLLFTGREELGIEVFAAHYEHGLRGAEALRDADFVSAWCARRGIDCAVEHGDAALYARENGLGTEEAARELRYAFLRRAAEKFSCGRIATAHNADDNTETMIFNLCRGSGAAGLRGIPPVRGELIRPLLGCTRADIEKYNVENCIEHVEDSSNLSDDYSRNLIRHRVMPALRELNPELSAAAGRASRLLREDERCLDALAEEFIRRFFDGESLPQEELSRLPEAVASRAVRRLCPRSLALKHVDAVLALRRGDTLAFADVPGLRVRREQGRIYFAAPQTAALPDRLLVPGQTLFIPEAGLRLSSGYEAYKKEINGLFKTYCFKSANICGNIICTGRRAGDKMRPLGRNCTKSLKQLFAEAGMTQRERDLAPVLRDDTGILAVCGLAADERTAPAAGDRVLRINIEREKTGR